MMTEEETREKLVRARADLARMQMEVQQLTRQQAAIRERAAKLQSDIISCSSVVAAYCEVLGEPHAGQEQTPGQNGEEKLPPIHKRVETVPLVNVE